MKIVLTYILGLYFFKFRRCFKFKISDSRVIQSFSKLIIILIINLAILNFLKSRAIHKPHSMLKSNHRKQYYLF